MPGHDFDYTDHEHQLVPMAADETVGDRRQILVPVDQQMEEFVQAGENWRDGKAEAQDQLSLPGRRARHDRRMNQ